LDSLHQHKLYEPCYEDTHAQPFPPSHINKQTFSPLAQPSVELCWNGTVYCESFTKGKHWPTH